MSAWRRVALAEAGEIAEIQLPVLKMMDSMGAFQVHTYIVIFVFIYTSLLKRIYNNECDNEYSDYVIHRLDDAVVEYGKQFDSLMILLKEQVRKINQQLVIRLVSLDRYFLVYMAW